MSLELRLTTLAGTRLRRRRYQSGLLNGFLSGTGLDLTLPSSPLQER